VDTQTVESNPGYQPDDGLSVESWVLWGQLASLRPEDSYMWAGGFDVKECIDRLVGVMGQSLIKRQCALPDG
jgi:hypothetical protein